MAAISRADVDKALKALGVDGGDGFESVVITADHVYEHRQVTDGTGVTRSTEHQISK